MRDCYALHCYVRKTLFLLFLVIEQYCFIANEVEFIATTRRSDDVFFSSLLYGLVVFIL